MTKEKTKDLFFGVDLHIHTPASSCYKGPRTDDEYLAILRRCITNDIKIIAITDHNTIKGYRKLIGIQKELKNKLKLLVDLVEKYPDLKREHLEVKCNLELFDKLLILPGIEFEANPGIHILLIFKPDINIDTIDLFLAESGYPEDLQGIENPEVIPKLDVLQLLIEADRLNALVIAAHADSDKGIYDSLSGKYRASVFSSSYLHAIAYNSPVTSQKMKEMLQNKSYKRENPIAFIQCSDYHGEGEPGTVITYLKLEHLSFDAVYQSLKNPNECVSPTQHPEIINILRQIISDHKTYVFRDVDSEMQTIKQTACALLNDGYGTLVIGAVTEPNSNIIGISKNYQQCEQIINEIVNSIDPRKIASRDIYLPIRHQTSLSDTIVK